MKNPSKPTILGLLIDIYTILCVFYELLYNHQNSSPLQEEQYLDSADVKMQFNISERTLYRMRKEGKIPYVYFGRKIFYPKSEIYKMLKQIK